MKDSNQFHAVALDTYPPAVYMNDVSHAIVDLVHCYNAAKGMTKVDQLLIIIHNFDNDLKGQKKNS